VTLQEAEFAIGADPAGVASARRFTRECLDRWALGDLADTAVLLVSEAVTNVLLHAHTPGSLRLVVHEQVLRVEVRDGSSRLPFAKGYQPTAATGRGLQLIEALSDRWGSEAEAGGKRTWFELAAPPSEDDDASVCSGASRREPGPR
jgi:anti-sigma regulatory factor (Ser/Thr protein kinase)